MVRARGRRACSRLSGPSQRRAFPTERRTFPGLGLVRHCCAGCAIRAAEPVVHLANHAPSPVIRLSIDAPGPVAILAIGAPEPFAHLARRASAPAANRRHGLNQRGANTHAGRDRARDASSRRLCDTRPCHGGQLHPGRGKACHHDSSPSPRRAYSRRRILTHTTLTRHACILARRTGGSTGLGWHDHGHGSASYAAIGATSGVNGAVCRAGESPPPLPGILGAACGHGHGRPARWARSRQPWPHLPHRAGSRACSAVECSPHGDAKRRHTTRGG